MNNRRSHLKMICLVSVAVLLGACSSTPDVEEPNVADIQASLKQSPSKKIAILRPIKQEKLASIATRSVPTKVVRKTVVKRKVAPAVVSRKPVYVPKKQKRYVPPKPIVVAVHSAPKPVIRVENPNLRRPSLPRASAAVVASKPLFRPATVPARNTKRVPSSNAQYLARKRQQAQQQQARIQRAQQEQARAEQVQQQQARIQRVQQEQARAEQVQQQQARIQRVQQQQAREQWEKEQQRLVYLVKWEKDQVAKIQEQQARVQQAQQS